ncbi:DNA-binding response regulator, OmpR family, contains REC and winged-helix (wHTH) domain [Alteribacillus persepolensis]|uniref:DNA-binding response regulator, OmpR family, contains REC and winged-helix (WHTH) domain n=1 Tax=Alteribacillus persepolensis TaxID=568899 RepID=A0A1G8AAB0_9BACI|nr:response regulator transcription factor [Alteribacillus persepolensis]SDH17829.1 DNA-binding response regulator, OmpR family, contains REC and winged-helix (wHTH) domain [Alteribacillus persepolensis]
MTKVLIIEDEAPISKVLQAYMQKEGYEVRTVLHGDEAMPVFYDMQPDLAIVDVMLPGKNGWDILEEIRAESAAAVIMLTALGDVDYRLKGLNSGADDYIAKPFDASEVVARVKAVLRRTGQFLQDEEVKHFGSLTLNEKAHTVKLNGADVPLSPRDLSLLFFLARHPNQTFDREQLIEHVWGIDYEGSDRAVDLSIKRIRKSLQNWPESEGEIKTLRGLGYQFCVYE